MKSKTKSEIAAFLEDFQKRLSAVNKAVKKRAEIESDAAQFEATIADLGEPNYKDDEKISLLATTQLKLKSCQAALEKQNTKIGGELAQLADILAKGADFARDILMEVVANRHETITNCLLPFCINRAGAEYLARQTDAGRGGFSIAAGYSTLASQVRKFSGQKSGFDETPADYAASEAARVIRTAEKIERVLVESVSKAPDLMQFIPFTPSSAIGASDEAEPQTSRRKTKTPVLPGPQNDRSSTDEAAAVATDATTEGDDLN